MTRTDLASLAEGAGDAPGITLLAIAMGILLIIAAIRAMFGKRKR
jgi:hypothetical protein